MIVQEIYDYVVARVDRISSDRFFNELKQSYADIWYQVDTRDSLFEMELEATNERQITLPWFVLDVRGIRDYGTVPMKIMSPRPYYNLDAPAQSDYEWRMLHRTPLYATPAVIGRLTFKARRALSVPITINTRGPGDYGVTEVESLSLPAGQRTVESVAVYSDLTSLSKSALTTADIEVFDIQGNQIGMIPADKTDVWCQLCQLVDSRTVRTGGTNNRYFTLLFKKTPPTVSTFNDAVPDEYGMILKDMIISSILGTSKDENDRKVADRADGKANANLTGVLSKAVESQSARINTGRSPYYKRSRSGLL